MIAGFDGSDKLIKTGARRHHDLPPCFSDKTWSEPDPCGEAFS
jgi:hypothetical protein